MNLSESFSFKVQKAMARYMATFNIASQALAVDDGGPTDIQTTGLQLAYFDGAPIKLPADAALDISADAANESVTAWANSTSYSLGDIRANSNASAGSSYASDTRLRCIEAHTSNEANDEPEVSSRWEEKWVREPHEAYTAGAATVGVGNTREFLVLAERDGTLNPVLCGDDANSTTGFSLEVPLFDPYTYVPVGFMHVINADPTNAFTLGTTNCDNGNAGNDVLMTVTYHQCTTPIFPHVDNIDKT